MVGGGLKHQNIIERVHKLFDFDIDFDKSFTCTFDRDAGPGP